MQRTASSYISTTTTTCSVYTYATKHLCLDSKGTLPTPDSATVSESPTSSTTKQPRTAHHAPSPPLPPAPRPSDPLRPAHDHISHLAHRSRPPAPDHPATLRIPPLHPFDPDHPLNTSHITPPLLPRATSSNRTNTQHATAADSYGSARSLLPTLDAEKEAQARVPLAREDEERAENAQAPGAQGQEVPEPLGGGATRG